ncbi:MAG: fused MFS/spermidine synthase [Patescibacteria group bacterium]
MKIENISNKKILYAISSFIAGFVVMTIELISNRIMAPLIGGSVFTWTSVIGVTLLGLAGGNFLGGIVADKKYSNVLPLTFLASGFFVVIIPLLAEHTNFILNSINSIMKLNLSLALYLFLLPTLSIGMIQPIILKKFADDFTKIGSHYGILSFTWSLGGILGVFLTGFFFVSYLGTKETVWFMAGLLFILGLVYGIRNKKILFTFIGAGIMIIGLIYTAEKVTEHREVLFNKETNYYNAKVVDTYSSTYGSSRVLLLDFSAQSYEFQAPTEIYTDTYPLFSYLKKEINDILVIGAGAYIIPKHLVKYYPKSKVLVAELDPEVVNIGNNFFDLKKYNIETTIGDAKIVLKKSPQKYDVIFSDAYTSFISVPWYLLTKEWNDEIKQKLNNDGIYAINLIGSLSGNKSEFIKSTLKTFQLSFPSSYVFAMGDNTENIQNIILVGIKGKLPMSEKKLYEKLLLDKSFLAKKLVKNEPLNNSRYTILTNNFAPTEKLLEPIVKYYFPFNTKEINKILKNSKT